MHQLTCTFALSRHEQPLDREVAESVRFDTNVVVGALIGLSDGKWGRRWERWLPIWLSLLY
jgi:hypothetical protein